jgi:methylisocitrate lyase
VINAYCALLAQRAGVPALYVSGGATAACLGLPDLGVLSAHDLVEVTAKVTAATDLPVLVDADTGFGDELAIGRAVRMYEAAGASGLHLEDQAGSKRCGHRPGKQLCSAIEMAARIDAACAARKDPSLVVMARTDAIAVEGLDAAIERAQAYVDAGADMVFLEGATNAEQYAKAAQALGVPILANITEFGVTPLLELDDLAAAKVALALYPLTAFRVMAKAAEGAYASLVADGGQASLIELMQTRDELYGYLDYHRQEGQIDKN